MVITLGGRLAIPAGMIMYGSIAVISQFFVIKWRHWKQDRILSNNIENSVIQKNSNVSEPSLWSSEIWKKPFRNTADGSIQKQTPPDPIASVLNRLRDAIYSRYSTPPWISPFLNAFDVDYRKKLNYKIEHLETQIEILKERINKIDS